MDNNKEKTASAKILEKVKNRLCKEAKNNKNKKHKKLTKII
ncbi:hypothetical protein [Oenococcus oeni]|nr:hypothetical protein [Oenococcus oeni]